MDFDCEKGLRMYECEFAHERFLTTLTVLLPPNLSFSDGKKPDRKGSTLTAELRRTCAARDLTADD